MDDHEGPRLTVSQELARILGKKPAEAPELTFEEFPSLPSGSGGAGTGPAGSADYGTAATRTRPRSRSPTASAWSGAKGKHLEGGRQQVLQWPQQAKGAEPKQAVERQAQGQSSRKRSSEDRKDQTRISKKEEVINPKIQRLTKERDTQPKEVIAPGKKRELEAEGFKRLFPDMTQASKEQNVEQGTTTKDTASRTEGSRPKERRIGQDGHATGHQGAGKGKSPSRAAGGESPIPTHNRFAELDEGVQAEEVARKADADKEDRSKDNWDPEKRNLDIAKRKQQWKEDCKGKEQAQRLEEAQSNVPAKETGGNLGTDPREAASSAHPFGSSTLVEKGPEAAGRPVPSDQPPAEGGGDRGERVDRPGQLVQCGGRKGGLPEPVSAPLTARSSKDRVSSFSSCSAQPIRKEGHRTPPMFLAFQGAAAPRKPDASAPND